MQIDLIRSFLQFDGQLQLDSIMRNYDSNGGVKFSGYKEIDGKYKYQNFVIDKEQIELLNSCKSIMEIYEYYKEMEFFK